MKRQRHRRDDYRTLLAGDLDPLDMKEHPEGLRATKALLERTRDALAPQYA